MSTMRKPKRGRDERPAKRKFIKLSVAEIDYKNVNLLRRFVTEKGKIRSRRITGLSKQQQAAVAREVKRAREMALLPYQTR